MRNNLCLADLRECECFNVVRFVSSFRRNTVQDRTPAVILSKLDSAWMRGETEDIP
jgi:hypothetical protein